MKLFRPLFLLLAIGCSMGAWATHNRAGEIIVCQVGGPSSLLYEITIITHTKLSAPADRPELAINYGDSPIWDTIPRTNIQEAKARISLPALGCAARISITPRRRKPDPRGDQGHGRPNTGAPAGYRGALGTVRQGADMFATSFGREAR